MVDSPDYALARAGCQEKISGEARQSRTHTIGGAMVCGDSLKQPFMAAFGPGWLRVAGPDPAGFFVSNTKKSPVRHGASRASSDQLSSVGIERRAWDSNPQPLAGHLISSQGASQFAYPPAVHKSTTTPAGRQRRTHAADRTRGGRRAAGRGRSVAARSAGTACRDYADRAGHLPDGTA